MKIPVLAFYNTLAEKNIKMFENVLKKRKN